MTDDMLNDTTDDIFGLILTTLDCPASSIMLGGTCKRLFERVSRWNEVLMQCEVRRKTPDELINIVVAAGQVPILKYLGGVKRVLYARHMNLAIKHNRLEMVRHLHNEYVAHGNILYIAARYGRVGIVEWYTAEVSVSNHCVRRALGYAAEYGSLEVVRFLHNKYDRDVCDFGTDCIVRTAMCNGQLHVLKYLVEEYGEVLSENLFYTAAIDGKLQIVEYFIEKGWPITDKVVERVICSKQQDMIDVIQTHVPLLMIAGQMGLMIRHNNFPLLSRLLDNGFSLPWNACTLATLYGGLDMMKLVGDNGGQYTPDAYSRVCMNIKDVSSVFEKIKYLRQIGIVPFPTDICRKPAEYGHLHIIKYLVDNGAVIDDMSIYWAAYRQRRDILRYAHDRGLDVRGMVVRASWHVDVHRSAEVRRWIKTFA